jgi:hypothetical protein
MSGKGSKQRPTKISEFIKNFDKITWSKKSVKPTKIKKGKQIYVY